MTSNFSMTFEFIEVSSYRWQFFRRELYREYYENASAADISIFNANFRARARAVPYNRVNGNGSIARSIWNEIVISMFPFTRAYVALLFRGNGSTYVPGAAS